MTKSSYRIINILVLLIAFVCASVVLLRYQNECHAFIHELNIPSAFFVFLLGFLLIHLTKAFRVSLILLGKGVRLQRLTRLYVKTTFVNITIPFKLGEVFRFYCYGQELNNYREGLLCVLIDRYFDTCALLLITVPVEFLLTHKCSNLSLLLLGMVFALFIIYIFLPTLCAYIKHNMIYNVNSTLAVHVLELNENILGWYEMLQKMLKGRILTLLVVSCFTWLLEYGLFKVILTISGKAFGMLEFSNYLNSILTNDANQLKVTYTGYGALTLAVIMLCVYAATRRKTYEK